MKKKENKTDILLQQVKKTVLSIDPHSKVILFGSRARGEENTESDWDFLILTHKTVTPAVEDEFRYPLYEIEWETGNVISTIIFSDKEWKKHIYSPFYKNVSKEGIEI